MTNKICSLSKLSFPKTSTVHFKMSMFGYDDQYGDYYDPFSDDVLSIVTQRDKNESLSPITKFWSQPEFLPTSQPAVIVDTEQGNQIDFAEECLSLESLTDIFSGDD